MYGAEFFAGFTVLGLGLSCRAAVIQARCSKKGCFQEGSAHVPHLCGC